LSDERRYGSPAAFRRVLTDKLRAAAAEGEWSLQELQRQFSYDRLLARLYADDEPWIVKGATALIARRIAVRSTIDIDIYRERSVEKAEHELRDACERDMDDWFSFRLGASQSVNDGIGVRIKVAAYIGETAWSRFHIDLVGSDLRMTGQPDAVAPLAIVEIAQVEQSGYLAYPIVDHVADKACAIFQRYGPAEAPSTRFKDLVDLVAIFITTPIDAEGQTAALTSEASRRSLTLPDMFAVPDHRLWERGYPAEANRSSLPTAHSLDEAIEIVRGFIDPVLRGDARGSWRPGRLEWDGGRVGKPSSE
jgi:hypothetical protein